MYSTKLGGLKHISSNDKIAIFAMLVSILLRALVSSVWCATVTAPLTLDCAVTCGYTTVHKELGSSSSTSTDHHNNNKSTPTMLIAQTINNLTIIKTTILRTPFNSYIKPSSMPTEVHSPYVCRHRGKWHSATSEIRHQRCKKPDY